MKEIALTRGYKAIVDDEDYEELSKWSWHALDNHGKIYARTAKKINGKNHYYFMHGLLLSCKDGLEVDHIDRNPLNNRRENLRCITHSENCLNREKRGDGKCPKCREREVYGMLPYCRECFNEYQRERRKKPKIRAKEAEIKRNYRKRTKESL